MRKRNWLLRILWSVLVLSVLAFCVFGAYTAEAATYKEANNKFRAVVNGELNAKEALDYILAVNFAKESAYNRCHLTYYVADLYYRLGDYDKCKEWALKVLDTKELNEARVTRGQTKLYPHGLTAAAILANAAAEFGRPEDVDMVESKIAPKEMTTKVYVKYCWTSSPQNTLRTMLRFYKALAYKNAGNPEAAREIVEVSSFNTGSIRVGNKFIPFTEAAELLKD